MERDQLPEFDLIEAFERNFPDMGKAEEVMVRFGDIAGKMAER